MAEKADSVADAQGIPPASNDEGHRPLSPSWRKEALSLTESTKFMQILKACRDKDRRQLMDLASTEGGFIEDELRRLAWPLLLGVTGEDDSLPDWRNLPSHREEGQVALDVNRAFVYYPAEETEKQIDGRKAELGDLITATLRQHPDLCYFQGYHDIAQVLLLVLGAKQAVPSLARLSLLRIRDFMLPTLSATNSHLALLPSILYAADPDLCKHLSGIQPYFALAATLTLYAHDIEEYGGIARLFDFLLAREAVVSVYMFAVTVMIRKDELYEIEADEPEMLYAILCKLPKPLDIEALIAKTALLFAQHPPTSLPSRTWRDISSYSVLKTTQNMDSLEKQSLKDGEVWLKKQAAEIERAEARKKILLRTKVLAQRYRRPAGALTLAVIVGVLSVWLGKSSPYTHTLGNMTQRMVDAFRHVTLSLRG